MITNYHEDERVGISGLAKKAASTPGKPVMKAGYPPKNISAPENRRVGRDFPRAFHNSVC
jgi:hypothetical protein